MRRRLGFKCNVRPKFVQPQSKLARILLVAPPAISIFLIFLRLGLTSFGGPIAHLGYFRAEFVERRQWLSDADYTELVALAQFVPGPASSQTGFAVGLRKGGLLGGFAAWLGFTLPSALSMFAAAKGLTLTQSGASQGIVHGLKLLAVGVVAQAVWSMGRSFCPDRIRAAFAIIVAAALIAIPGSAAQLAAIGLGAAFGLFWLGNGAVAAVPALKTSAAPGWEGIAALLLFLALLFGLPFFASFTHFGIVELASAFYRAGALVFGGGHVVLPLLQESVVAPGWVSRDDFLAGYGAAQALPGPIFTISAFLGAKANIASDHVAGAIIALLAIFLPGMLLMYGIIPYWRRLRTLPKARAALNGVNCAVAGILAAALYQPVWTSTIAKPLDASIALLAFMALSLARLPVLLVVVLCAAIGIVMAPAA